MALGALLCLLAWGMSAHAKEVQLEEVGLSLYNKPVTGFRLVLDRSEQYVATQVIAHVAAADDAHPFQYERSIIYENIRYAPIAPDHDISLYYLLRGIQGQFTELTLVAMYDYRRAISSRDFPDMAQRLKVDMARLVQFVAGDVMRCGDVLYDAATIARLSHDGAPPAAEDKQPVAEHAQQEEVDRNKVLLHKDPFQQEPKAADNDTALKRLQARVQVLEQEAEGLREEVASLQRKQDIVQAKLKSHKALQDSVNMLNERVEALMGQAYIADDVSISNETAMRLQELDKENARLKKQLAQSTKENDSLAKAIASLESQLASLGNSGRSSAERLATLNDENKQLRRELEDYKARAALQSPGQAQAADSLLGLLAKANGKVDAMAQEMEALNRKSGRMKQENDELSARTMQLEERLTTLEAENRSLREGNAEMRSQLPDEHLMDSLNGEIRAARRSASIAKAEATQVRADLAALQEAKDAQAKRLADAEREVMDLQVRIEALQAQAGGEGANSKTTNAAQADSILLLKQRLYRAEDRAAEAERIAANLKDVEATLQAKERALSTAETNLRKKDIELGDALRAKANTQQALENANAQLNEARNARSGSQQELDRLNQENKALTAKLGATKDEAGRLQGENKTLGDSLAALRSQRAGLRRDLEARDRSVRAQIAARDSMQARLADADNREKELRRTIDAMQARVDSLARVRVPEGEQAKYLKEQRAKLDQWQKDLEAAAATAADKEKLLTQRESVMSQREADMASQSARFKDLEERERRVQLREQQVAAKEGTPTVNTNSPVVVKEGRLVEFGTQVPVFIAESPLPQKALQRQVVGFMLSRDELLDSYFPEILFRAARLPELDTEPVEMKVRIDSQQNGCSLQISFRLSDGQYLGPDHYRERGDAAKQLIGKMLRYKI